MRLIEVENVSKIFHARSGPHMLVARGGFVNLFRRRREAVAALQDITFSVEQGEAVGIIGANGSGKSTLLKLLAGVTVPTTGRVEIRGRVASLLELGAGFHPLLTGRENVYLNARILGLNHEQVNRVFDAIVEFSGIEEFIDNPVNTYSSGMYVRLGFAVAVHADPDVFLVDEVLSVGDEEFQRKCRKRIGELREQGKTIVFVSHDLSIVNTLCTRVVLLSKGRMISRGTPRDTIDFYLRQIGRSVGIHTFAGGRLEAILCHGRVSLFRDQREITAAGGFRMTLQSLGQFHESMTADWVVEERGADSCTARGRMPRMPVTLLWEMRIEGDRFVWRARLECEQATEIPQISAELFWPLGYLYWQYGESAGAFPDILPGDLNWSVIVPPEFKCLETTVLPKEDEELPPLLATLEALHPFLALQWANSDFVEGSRVLQAITRDPETAWSFPAGRHDLFSLTLDFGMTAAELRERAERIQEGVRAREREKIVTRGKIAGRFDLGKIRIAYDGAELTGFLHFYTSMLIGNLWNDSQHLEWHPHERTGQRLVLTGDCRRFPYTQQWEIEAIENGVAARIWLEVHEPLDVHEYHASVVLRPDYSYWKTEFEAGAYPEFEPGLEDWRHANRLYNVGKWAKALSSALPSVTLTSATDDVPFRMTAINTGHHENARVLQALRIPDAGMLHFERGRHLYFEGTVTVNPDEFCVER